MQTTIGSGLSLPDGLAVDRAGDVFIADVGHQDVVEVTPSGSQTTIVSGLNDPSGLAVDGAGDLFVSDSGSQQVVEVTPAGVQPRFFL